MTTILALDTSSDACSVALWRDGQITEKFELAAQSHTQRALPMIDELLTEEALSLSQLDALAIGAGPGSFTGLRIGLGVIQGLAFAADLPVVAVSTLEAMAWQQVSRNTGDIVLMPALDARMGEVYWALYRYCQASDSLEVLVEPSVCPPERVGDALPDGLSGLVGVGSGWAIETMAALASEPQVDCYPRAGALVALAARDFDAGRGQSVDQVQPNYVRDTVSWKKRERIRQ